MSLHYDQFDTVRVQVVLFTPGGQLAVTRVLSTLLEQFPEVFSGDPLALPKADIDEFPRIILGSVGDAIVCEIAPGRAAVAWNKRKENETCNVPEFLSLAHHILSTYQEAAPAKAGRLALVIYRLAPVKNATEEVTAHFCQEKWTSDALGGLRNFEWHALRRYSMDEFEVNCWTRVKTGETNILDEKALPTTISTVHVEQDINTLSEVANEVVFDSDQRRKFWSMAHEEIERLMVSFFPGE